VHSTSEEIAGEISMPAGRRHARMKVPRHRTRTAQRTEQQNGSSTFLYGIERCIAERCKILGLYAPTDVNVTGTVTFADLWELAQQDAGPRGLVALPGGAPAPGGSELT
jgi:hypothetical protein